MNTSITWLPFSPSGLRKPDILLLCELGRSLISLATASLSIEQCFLEIERLRRRTEQRLESRRQKSHQRLLAALHILCDLAKQGWRISVVADDINIGRPSTFEDQEEDRLRIRRQLHAERDEQLREDSVRAFVQMMESRRVFKQRMVSIFSLMADGRELSSRLAGTTPSIRPYLQFIRSEETCEHTGLRLIDVWRYFRHTWATPYRSVPGRTMMILVRDEAVPFHPVIGIAALSSATVGLSVRDEHIGWTYKALCEHILSTGDVKYLKWMTRTLDESLDELYKEDLLEERVITRNSLAHPTPQLVELLIDASREHRKQHYRFMQENDYKDNVDVLTAPDEYWESKARSLLFRSKREYEIASLLSIKISMTRGLSAKPSRQQIADFISSPEGRSTLTKLIRKAKGDRVGTAIADLAVCGAIPPYNEVLGGKLVAALIASPDVTQEYRRRYGRTPSIIASSMSGKATIRAAELVFVSTTSLYGRRPNQYDRIAIPLDAESPTNDSQAIRFDYLGRTKGVGTFQFSESTVTALNLVLSQRDGGIRVNSIFGEGVNPRLRKLRDGLDELGLPTELLLDHGAPRLVYGVSLASNVAEYLLGIVKKPSYYATVGGLTARSIGSWWYRRWCEPRLDREETRAALNKHTLVHPIRHGARVQLPPPIREEFRLFDD